MDLLRDGGDQSQTGPLEAAASKSNYIYVWTLNTIKVFGQFVVHKETTKHIWGMDF